MIQHKIDYSISLLQKAEKIALAYHSDGFRLAFSGGKDSIVLYRLAQMAGVRFTAHMEVTTLDHPELMKFVRGNYPDVTLHRPKLNFYDLIKKKKMLPLMNVRYCCQYLKEQAGAGMCTLIGIRADESARRAGRNEVEISNHKYSNTLDQFNIDTESKHLCIKGKDKLLVSPIFHWTHQDIWRFIRDNNMSYCNLYDEGYTRIGCIFCPMASKKSKARDRLRYPGVERAIKKSIQYLIDTDGYGNRHNANADELFDWWVSNQSYDMFFGNLRTQRKIEFENF
jgi:phosphoadenosine phosphosulfate reductase